jgi:hypothetical protein
VLGNYSKHGQICRGYHDNSYGSKTWFSKIPRPNSGMSAWFSKNFKKSNNRPIKKPPVHCLFFHENLDQVFFAVTGSRGFLIV